MDIEVLKQKILDLAIRGKLVPQDPSDEPASVLIEKIKAEKAKLIKEGKIKASKDDSYIYKGSDNCYYEKFGSLPTTWKLCKFGEIVNISRGASPRPIKAHLTDEIDGIPWIKIGDAKPGDIYINQTSQKIKKQSANKSVFLKKGSLILSNSMSFGRPYILNIDGCVHDGWLAIETYSNTIDIEFLQYILQGYMWFFKSKAGGSSVDNLNIDKVKELPFALPPLNEQKRILFILRKIDNSINSIKNSNIEIEQLVCIAKTKVLDSIFGDNSSYKSYYPSISVKDVCKLDNGVEQFAGILPYLEAKVIRGSKEPKYLDKGIFISKGTTIILVDGENSGEIMQPKFDGYMGSTFKILKIDTSKINEEYISLFIFYKKQELRESKTGSAIPHLNKKIFNNYNLPLPNITKQVEIVTRIQNIFKVLDSII